MGDSSHLPALSPGLKARSPAALLVEPDEVVCGDP